jgi:hypothetical protein
MVKKCGMQKILRKTYYVFVGNQRERETLENWPRQNFEIKQI